MSRRAERPLARWYLIALGVVCVLGLVAIVLATIANPTEDTLIGLAVGVAPVAVVAVAAALRYLKARR